LTFWGRGGAVILYIQMVVLLYFPGILFFFYIPRRLFFFTFQGGCSSLHSREAVLLYIPRRLFFFTFQGGCSYLHSRGSIILGSPICNGDMDMLEWTPRETLSSFTAHETSATCLVGTPSGSPRAGRHVHR